MSQPRWVLVVVMAGLLIAGCTNKTEVAPFRPDSVTFVSSEVGFVIGLSSCSQGQCLRLARTADSGRTWTWVSKGVLSALSLSDRWHVRFADVQNGWISGPLLLATHNGGWTWTQIALPGLGSRNGSVGALEVADGRVFAEVAEGADPDTYGPVALFTTELSKDSWTAVGNVATGSAGYPGEISVAEGAIWAMLHPGVVSQDHEVKALSRLYHSPDGVSWQSSLQPCPPSTVASVAAATSSRVFIICSGGVAGGSQDKAAYLSTDGGASYKRVGDPPLTGDFDEVAASPLAFSVGAASGATYIYTSFNEGRDWATTDLPQTGSPALSDMRFTTSNQGVVIFGVPAYPQSLQLLMTRDGGLSWATIVVSPS